MLNRDYTAAFGIGVVSSVLWFFALQHLSLFSEGRLIALLALLPFVFVAIVAAIRISFNGALFHKMAKFLIVGVLNTGIDFFIFNGLIAITGMESGISLLLFKSISFAVALFNSYELNRWWTFTEEGQQTPSRSKEEFGRFISVTVISFLVNIGATAFIANMIHPQFGLTQVRWDNVAAAIATALNLLLNFIGYKLFVFKSIPDAA